MSKPISSGIWKCVLSETGIFLLIVIVLVSPFVFYKNFWKCKEYLPLPFNKRVWDSDVLRRQHMLFDLMYGKHLIGMKTTEAVKLLGGELSERGDMPSYALGYDMGAKSDTYLCFTVVNGTIKGYRVTGRH